MLKDKMPSSHSENEARVSTLTTPVEHCTEILNQCYKARGKEIEGYRLGRKK